MVPCAKESLESNQINRIALPATQISVLGLDRKNVALGPNYPWTNHDGDGDCDIWSALEGRKHSQDEQLP